MFVRWKRRKRLGKSRTSIRRREQWGDSLRGYLVKTERDGDRVRQKVVCYLGSFDEKTIGALHQREFFWKHATPRLDGLDLTDAKRVAIEARISETVPQLSDEETEQSERNYAAAEAQYSSIRAMLGGHQKRAYTRSL